MDGKKHADLCHLVNDTTVNARNVVPSTTSLETDYSVDYTDSEYSLATKPSTSSSVSAYPLDDSYADESPSNFSEASSSTMLSIPYANSSLSGGIEEQVSLLTIATTRELPAPTKMKELASGEANIDQYGYENLYLGPSTSQASSFGENVCSDADRRDAGGYDIDALGKKLSAIVNEQNVTSTESNTSAASLTMSSNMRLSPERRLSYNIVQDLAIICPLGDCKQSIAPGRLLAHFLNEHVDELSLELREVIETDCTVLSFYPKAFQMNRHCCLGVLLYKGTEMYHLPQQPGMMIENVDLSRKFAHLRRHLTLYIMACKASWDMFITPKPNKANSRLPNTINVASLYLVWAFCPQTLLSIQVTLNACDEQKLNKRSCFIETQNNFDADVFCDVMCPRPKFMRLTHGDVKILSKNFTTPVLLEVTLSDRTFN